MVYILWDSSSKLNIIWKFQLSETRYMFQRKNALILQSEWHSNVLPFTVSEMKWYHYLKLRTRELKLNFSVSSGNRGSNSFATLAELFPALSTHVRTDGMYKMTWISRGIKDNKTRNENSLLFDSNNGPRQGNSLRIPRILYLQKIKDYDMENWPEFPRIQLMNSVTGNSCITSGSCEW